MIQLDEDIRAGLLRSIQRFAAEEFEVDLGALRSERFLEFCLLELGPAIYNQAIGDAQARLQEQILDLDGTLYELPGSYWSDTPRRES